VKVLRPTQMLAEAAEVLRPVRDDVVVVGATALEVALSDSRVGITLTRDVDVVVPVERAAEVVAISNEPSCDAARCRTRRRSPGCAATSRSSSFARSTRFRDRRPRDFRATRHSGWPPGRRTKSASPSRTTLWWPGWCALTAPACSHSSRRPSLRSSTRSPSSPTGESQRYWDLIDLILLRDLLGDDLFTTRDACDETFSARGTHLWPPELVVPDG
jgi:hypothetical protein